METKVAPDTLTRKAAAATYRPQTVVHSDSGHLQRRHTPISAAPDATFKLIVRAGTSG